MNWLWAWWQSLRGYAPSDPWDADPRIQAARTDQHQRIDRATNLLAREGLALRRERKFWERHGLPRKTDDG
jgi:hypothetical protein